jgi:hypothetical protein
MPSGLSWRWLIPALLVAASGCGSGSNLFKVSGRLTYHGQPVSSTQVTFVPEDGSRASSAVTDGDGKFTLKASRTETGVIPGPHTVYLRYKPSPQEELGEVSPKASPELRNVLAKFKDQSTLHFQVNKDGQFIEIPLE